MALTATTVKNQLSKSKWIMKDNTAQTLINNATPTDIRMLEIEPVLRLYEALVKSGPSIFSANDAAALKKLKTNSQFQPVVNTPDTSVSIMKKLFAGTVAGKVISKELVERLYAAEKSRLSFLENIGIDGSTIGRGQVGQLSYIDVKDKNPTKKTWIEYFTRVAISDLLSRKNTKASKQINFDNYNVEIPNTYNNIILSSKALEDFVVTAYLCHRIKASERPNRSEEDTVKIGVALYHGMSSMVRKAQQQLKSTTDWQPIEAELLKKGYADEIAYINEVVK